MTIDTLMAYSEVYEILKQLDEDSRKKVPESVREFLENERLKEYKPKIDIETPLIEQNLKRKTIVLLTMINLNYWCTTQQEKQEALDEITKNDKESQELLEKYNPDNLFKKKQEDICQNTEIVVYKKQSALKRFLDKIIRIIKKK